MLLPRTKNTYLSAQYRRLAARRGKKKAIVALEHTILVIAYHLIKRHELYCELGGDYFDKRRPEATAKRLVKRLEQDWVIRFLSNNLLFASRLRYFQDRHHDQMDTPKNENLFYFQGSASTSRLRPIVALLKKRSPCWIPFLELAGKRLK